MPKKKHFDRDLVTVNIKRLDHEGLLNVKRYGEPLYDVFHRVWVTYNSDKAAIENESEIRKENILKWKDRALKAEEQLGKVKQIFKQTKLET